MYIHMLGYPTHFGQMETLKLIASSGFPEKRIGYLGLSILLDERQEVLMLVTNSLKNDLNSGNHYTIGLALCALGTIASTEMSRDLAPEVERLMKSGNPYVRKKAALCAQRILKKVPELLESFIDLAADMLVDRSQSVLLAGVTLMHDICLSNNAAIAVLRDQVPALCRILRALQTGGGLSSEYDIGGVNNPFLQVRILRLLRTLGHGSAEASDAMSDALAAVAANTDGSRNAGNAVLYETVQTIMAIESIGGLRVLAVNILGRFLANRDNNMRYVALNTLTKVVVVDTQAVQRHRATIVSCVKDADNSIRKRALELVFALVNEGNIKTLTKELLDYLKVCDEEFKPDLTAKICQLVARFAPDRRWHVDSMAAVLIQAGTFATEDACRALILLVVGTPQLHGYSARKFYAALEENLDCAQPALVTVACWYVGEYAELLVDKNASLLEEEKRVIVSTEDVLDLLAAVLSKRQGLSDACREVALTAIAKCTARLPSCKERAKLLLEKHCRSQVVEIQTRAVEFRRLFNFESITPLVLEHIPPIEEGVYDATLDESVSNADNSAANAAADLAALLGLDVGPEKVLDENTPLVSTMASALQDMALAAEDGTRPTLCVFDKNHVTIDFKLSKSPEDPSNVMIEANIHNGGASMLTEVSLQAAVPKYMTLKLEPATGTALKPNATITQSMRVTNSMYGQKKLAMRLRLICMKEGQQMIEQAEVSNFPEGY